MHLIVLVINDPNTCSTLLEAWERAGVPGATILESLGFVRAQMGMRDDIPLLPSLSDLEEKDNVRHRTLFSVVRDMETVEKVIRITEKIIGPLERENTGFLFVVPVTAAYGMHEWKKG